MLQQRRPVGLAAVWLALWLAIMLVAACSAGVSGLLDSFAPAPTEIQAYPTKRPTPVPTVDPCARLAGRPAECPPLADYTPQNPECSPWKDYGIIEIYSLPDIDQARACWLGENYPQWAFQHLEGCQRCQDFAYHEQHGEFAPVGSYYKDGKVYKNATAYFRNFATCEPCWTATLRWWRNVPSGNAAAEPGSRDFRILLAPYALINSVGDT